MGRWGPPPVLSAPARLGIAGVVDVRQGKHFELEVDDTIDDDTLERVAADLLANPVIEDWVVTRVGREVAQEVAQGVAR